MSPQQCWTEKNMNKDCDQYKYDQFLDLSEARQACRMDKNCSGVLDPDCGGASQSFHLCPNGEDILHHSESSCIHDKIILGNYWSFVFLVDNLII